MLCSILINITAHCLHLRHWFIELSMHGMIYIFIFRFTFFLHALVQSVDVLLDWPPHADLIDDVRRFFRGQTVVKI